MNDDELIGRIGSLVDEEHRLEDAAGPDGLDETERERLRRIEVALDQCWDLLRQRRARRRRGEDPDVASVRPEHVVEDYKQ